MGRLRKFEQQMAAAAAGGDDTLPATSSLSPLPSSVPAPRAARRASASPAPRVAQEPPSPAVSDASVLAADAESRLRRLRDLEDELGEAHVEKEELDKLLNAYLDEKSSRPSSSRGLANQLVAR